MTRFTARSLASLPSADRERFLASLTDEEAAAFLYDWTFWARDNQLCPGGMWSVWLLLAGRGFGKTRTGAEWIRAEVESGRASRIALAARTSADAREVMVEGESGILAVSPAWFRPTYEPSKRRLTWPNGAIATTYSSEEPDLLRGPQHDAFWADELAAWRYMETWDQLQFGLRLGANPRGVVTTTPRPLPLLKELLADPSTVVTRGSTFDNAENLAGRFLTKLREKYEGTRLGRQEIEAELLEDVPGALWTHSLLSACRVRDLPEMQRIVIGVDPSGTKGNPDDRSDDIGIVVAGKGVDGFAYVIEDLTCNMSPAQWGARVAAGFHRHMANLVVAEVNFGGAMVEYVVKQSDQTIPVKTVTASRGKIVRAEPIAALYEQGRVKHLGRFAELEEQMMQFTGAGYVGARSPDRADALVWALSELMLGGAFVPRISIL